MANAEEQFRRQTEQHAAEMDIHSRRLAELQVTSQASSESSAAAQSSRTLLEKVVALEARMHITSAAHKAYCAEKERIHGLALTQAVQDKWRLEEKVQELEHQQLSQVDLSQTWHTKVPAARGIADSRTTNATLKAALHSLKVRAGRKKVCDKKRKKGTTEHRLEPYAEKGQSDRSVVWPGQIVQTSFFAFSTPK